LIKARKNIKEIGRKLERVASFDTINQKVDKVIKKHRKHYLKSDASSENSPTINRKRVLDIKHTHYKDVTLVMLKNLEFNIINKLIYFFYIIKYMSE